VGRTGADRFRVTPEDAEAFREMHHKAVEAEQEWKKAWDAYRSKPDLEARRLQLWREKVDAQRDAVFEFRAKYPDMWQCDWKRVVKQKPPRPLTRTERGIQTKAVTRDSLRVIRGGKG
jgi:transketolase